MTRSRIRLLVVLDIFVIYLTINIGLIILLTITRRRRRRLWCCFDCCYLSSDVTFNCAAAILVGP